MTDRPPPSTPPPPPQEHAVAPGPDGTTLQLLSCSSAATRCFICELDELRNQTFGNGHEASKFSEEELVYNVVGVRRRDSISDKFDDFMSVFLKLPGAKAAEELQKTFENEKDYLEDWDRIFGLAKSKFRVTTCTKRGATYAIGFFDKVSTDPGLTDDAVEKFEHTMVKARTTLAGLKTQVAEQETKQKTEEETVTKLTEARDALPPDPPKKKNGPKVGPRGKAEAAVVTAEGKVEKTKKKIEDLKAKSTAKEAEIAELEPKLADSRAKREKIAMFGKGEDGGLEPGRGQLNVGVYSYSVGVHKGGGKLDHSHPAYVMNDVPKDALRYYSSDWILENGVEEMKGTEVACLVHAGKEVAEAMRGTVAVLAGPPKKVVIQRDGNTIDVEPGATLAVYGVIQGANLHRGHNTSYDQETNRIAHRYAGEAVKDFSLGCQVHQDFDSFNAFLRLGQLAKRYACVKFKQNSKAPSCARLVRGTGAELSSGERALEVAYGRKELLGFDASKVAKEKSLDEARKKILLKKKAAWTPALAQKLAEARALPVPDNKAAQAALAKLEAAEWTTADENELKALEDDMEELDAEADLTKAEQEELAAGEAARDAEIAVAKLEANNLKKKEKDRLDEVTLRAKNSKEYEKVVETKKKHLEAIKKVEELKKKVKRFHAFLRERCGFFGADFIRECEPGRQCGSKTRYILVQADQPVANDLLKRFQRKPQLDWDGKLALKQS